jgi:hypothetical protein
MRIGASTMHMSNEKRCPPLFLRSLSQYAKERLKPSGRAIWRVISALISSPLVGGITYQVDNETAGM